MATNSTLDTPIRNTSAKSGGRDGYLSAEQVMLTDGQAYALGSTRQMTNLTAGGQNGLSNDLRTITANAPYVSRQTWCILLEAPRAFAYLPNPKTWVSTLKALVETHVETFDGLNKSIRQEFVDTNFGASEVQQETSRVTRERSEVTMKWTDYKGRPINRFLEGWITLVFGNPDTQIPGLVAFEAFRSDPMSISYTPDFNSATMLFFETDEYFRTVDKAWLITDMKPDNAGDVTGRKDLTAAGEKSEISVKFTGVQQVGEGVDAFAQRVVNSMGKFGLNTSSRRAFIGDDYQSAMDTWVANAKKLEGSDITQQGLGFFHQVHELEGEENVLQPSGSGVVSRNAYNQVVANATSQLG